LKADERCLTKENHMSTLLIVILLVLLLGGGGWGFSRWRR
jgi:LPXTG-motif cell wall-anchored protein